MVEKAYIEFKKSITDTGPGERFTVPFNPAELTFDSPSPGRDKSPDKKEEINGGGIQLKMKLVFDDSLNETGSVQKDAERFLEAARIPMKRRVLFQWGDIGFDGLLQNISVSYEMFSKEGRPVRAKADLTICSRNDSIMVKEWKKDYEKLFGIKG